MRASLTSLTPILPFHELSSPSPGVILSRLAVTVLGSASPPRGDVALACTRPSVVAKLGPCGLDALVEGLLALEERPFPEVPLGLVPRSSVEALDLSLALVLVLVRFVAPSPRFALETFLDRTGGVNFDDQYLKI